MAEAAPFAVMLPWRGKRYSFAYGLDQWRVLQRDTGFGPWMLEERCARRDASADEVVACLTQGLVAGGMSLAEADMLVMRNLTGDPGRLTEGMLVARLAMSRILYGVDKDVLGESAGATKAPKRRSRTARSTSASS